MTYFNSVRYNESFFKNLPSITIFSSKNSTKLFKEKIENMSNNNIELQEMVNIIYNKLITEEKDNHWTSEDYKNFKKEIFKIKNNEINIVMSSIKKSLLTSNSNIYKQLKEFSKEVDWYPTKEKIKEENSNIYKYVDKNIEVTDCFYIINSLLSYIKQYTGKYVHKLPNELLEEDVKTIISKIKNDFLKGYIKKYSYLKKYPLFIDIYINGYKESLKMLTIDIYNKKSDIELQKRKYTFYGSSLEGQRDYLKKSKKYNK